MNRAQREKPGGGGEESGRDDETPCAHSKTPSSATDSPEGGGVRLCAPAVRRRAFIAWKSAAVDLSERTAKTVATAPHRVKRVKPHPTRKTTTPAANSRGLGP